MFDERFVLEGSSVTAMAWPETQQIGTLTCAGRVKASDFCQTWHQDLSVMQSVEYIQEAGDHFHWTLW